MSTFSNLMSLQPGTMILLQSPGKSLRVGASPGPLCFKYLTFPVDHTHYGGHGGPWQGSGEAGGLAPMAQFCSSNSSPDSREMQRKMGCQTPEGNKRAAKGGRSSEPSSSEVPDTVQFRPTIQDIDYIDTQSRDLG